MPKQSDGPMSMRQELSKRARLALRSTGTVTKLPDEVISIAKVSNSVNIGLLRISGTGSEIGVHRLVPPTRGMRLIFTEGGPGSDDWFTVGGSEDVLWALEILRRHQVLDDLASIASSDG